MVLLLVGVISLAVGGEHHMVKDSTPGETPPAKHEEKRVSYGRRFDPDGKHHFADHERLRFTDNEHKIHPEHPMNKHHKRRPNHEHRQHPEHPVHRREHPAGEPRRPEHHAEHPDEQHHRPEHHAEYPAEQHHIPEHRAEHNVEQPNDNPVPESRLSYQDEYCHTNGNYEHQGHLIGTISVNVAVLV